MLGVEKLKTMGNRPSSRKFFLSGVLLALLLPVSPVFAQTASIPGRLSPDTIFYLHWRGSAGIAGADKKNHLLQLLGDPDFAPMRDSAVRGAQRSLETPGNPAPPLGLADVLSLLDNPVVLGVVASPPTSSATPDAAPPIAGVFFVYDTAGKTELIQRLKAANEQSGREVPTVLSYDFGGTKVEARTNGTNVSYTAQTKTHYLVSDQKGIIEDLITRFSGPAKPSSSVTQLPEYQAIRPYLGPDAAIEFFGRVPDLNKLIPADRRDNPIAKAALQLHLEKIHVLGGCVSFAGEATRVRGAALGDTSPGGPFDLLGPSRAIFLTQPIVYAGPVFSMARLDLAATYQLLRGAALAALNDQQKAAMNLYEGIAQNFLGMPIVDALNLLTGEFSSQSTFGVDGTLNKLFVISIQKPQDVTRILRAVAGGMIVGEETEGDATYLSLSYPYKDPETGQQRRQPYYLAVTPQFLFVAPRKGLLKDAVARGSSGLENGAPPNAGPGAEILHLRTLLPEKLSGFGGADLTRIPWDKLFLSAPAGGEGPPKTSPVSAQSPDWWKTVKPEALTRHLHGAVGGEWKDSSGAYFDWYIE